MSNKALSSFLQKSLQTLSAPNIARMSIQGAAATVDSCSVLWSGFLSSISSMFGVEANQLEPVLFIKKSRYDETPLKVRMQNDVQGQHVSGDTGEVSTHAKVMQTEFSVHILLRQAGSGKHWHIHGYIPTFLKLMDSTTAETTKAAVLMDHMQIPSLMQFSHGFKWKLQLSTVDRYAANLKCERSIMHDDHSWTKFTKSCDIHIIAQVHLRTSGILDHDVSGMLHTSLAQHGAGALQSMRDILQAIFQSELEVIYDIPPQGRIATHRQQVHDLFLPLGEASSLEGFSCTTLLRRYILGTMLNGDLESGIISHYCTFGCCKDYEDTMNKMCSYVVWALLPGKLPRFAKSRWNNQDRAVQWCGLLAAHHGLMTRILTQFTGVTEVHPQSDAKHASLAVEDNDNWGFLDSDGGGDGDVKVGQPSLTAPAPEIPEVQQQADAFDFDFSIFENVAAEPEDTSSSTGKTGTDWVKLNKAFKKNSGNWSLTDPGPRLVVMKCVMDVTVVMVNRALALAGIEFDRQQDLAAARGQQRTYRIVQAASGQDLGLFYDGLFKQLQSPPPALPLRAMTSNIKVLHFRMLSRAGCAMHMLLRRMRQGQPYKLFTFLTDAFDLETYNEFPCLNDELSAAFYSQFPEWSPAAEIALKVLAHSIDLDVAQLESRHAMSRRLACMKNLQTWVASAEALSADWSHRQASKREEEVYGTEVRLEQCAAEIVGTNVDGGKNVTCFLIMIHGCHCCFLFSLSHFFEIYVSYSYRYTVTDS